MPAKWRQIPRNDCGAGDSGGEVERKNWCRRSESRATVLIRPVVPTLVPSSLHDGGISYLVSPVVPSGPWSYVGNLVGSFHSWPKYGGFKDKPSARLLPLIVQWPDIGGPSTYPTLGSGHPSRQGGSVSTNPR